MNSYQPLLFLSFLHGALKVSSVYFLGLCISLYLYAVCVCVCVDGCMCVYACMCVHPLSQHRHQVLQPRWTALHSGLWRAEALWALPASIWNGIRGLVGVTAWHVTTVWALWARLYMFTWFDWKPTASTKGWIKFSGLGVFHCPAPLFIRRRTMTTIAFQVVCSFSDWFCQVTKRTVEAIPTKPHSPVYGRWKRRRALMSRSSDATPCMMRQYILDSFSQQQYDMLANNLNDVLVWCEEKITQAFANQF